MRAKEAELAFERLYEARGYEAGGRAICRVARSLLPLTSYGAQDRRYIRSYLEVCERALEGALDPDALLGGVPRNLEPYLERIGWFFTEYDSLESIGANAIRSMALVVYRTKNESDLYQERLLAPISKKIAKVIASDQ